MVKLINEWQGPLISMNYKRNHYDKKGSFQQTKFDKDSINWLDQSSYKVSGDYFFAKHIEAFYNFLNKNCNKNKNMIRFGSIYFIVQLLESTIKFQRCKPQQLIRNKTLVNSIGIHKALQLLYHELDLVKLKKIVKNNMKQKPKKKYRIDSKKFYENFRKYCLLLLDKEKNNLLLNINYDINNNNYYNEDDIIPDYFKEIKIKKIQKTQRLFQHCPNLINNTSFQRIHENISKNNNNNYQQLRQYRRQTHIEQMRIEIPTHPITMPLISNYPQNNINNDNNNNINNNNNNSTETFNSIFNDGFSFQFTPNSFCLSNDFCLSNENESHHVI